MAKLKYYRYALKEEGKFPKKGFVREEKAPDSFWGMAAYNTLLPEATVTKYNLVDMNGDIKFIARQRIMAGLTQKYVSDTLGVPFRTYQAWEMGNIGDTTLNNAIKVADFFGVKDLRDLLK